jgi:hypothetical protein
MSSHDPPARNDKKLPRNELLVCLLRALLQTAAADGPGIPLECLGLSPEEKTQLLDSGLVIAKGIGRWYLSKEAEQEAMTLLLAGQPVREQETIRIRPRYDAAKRELWWGNRLVKRWRKPAPFQLKVIRAFEADAWAPMVGDQFPNGQHTPGLRNDGGEVPVSSRLIDTVKSLNRLITPDTIRFGISHHGGVYWEPVQGANPYNPGSSLANQSAGSDNKESV